jgi:hypothetical protein
MAHRWDPVASPVSGLVRPVRVDPNGENGPTRGQSRASAWRLTSPGLFVPADVSDDLVEQRILEEYSRAGDRAVVTAWASLRLQLGGFFDGLDRDGRTRLPIPIAANGERLAGHPGIARVRNVVPDDEVVVIHGIRCAKAERALFDEVRRLGNDRDRIVAIDMTCAAKLTSLRRMRAYRWARYWYRDIRTLDRMLPLADEGARSRPEVDFRLIWELDAGWPHPLCNRAVHDLNGVLVGIPDLIDVKRRVVGEFAGADHRDIDQHQSDLERAADFRRVGLEIVEVVNRDLRDRERVVARMADAEIRAQRAPVGWRLGPPGPSLDAYLDRRDREAADPGPSSDARWSLPDDLNDHFASLDGY